LKDKLVFQVRMEEMGGARNLRGEGKARVEFQSKIRKERTIWKTQGQT
jgi:hypothetical protein